jgi:hypothetical protein
MPDQQLPLFDAREGERRRNRGMKRAASGAPSGFRRAALLAAYNVCVQQPNFTADDVWRVLGRGTSENRALGPVLKAAQRQGWCVPTHRTRQTERVTNHRRPLTIWLSRVFQERVEQGRDDGPSPPPLP